MLNRLALFILLWLGLGAQPAHAQYTVVDANGTFVGSVVGGTLGQTTLVAMQDGNSVWLLMELMAEGFVPNTQPEVWYYTDSSCSSAPYLLVTNRVSAVSGFTALFRRLEYGLPGQLSRQGHYAGDPVQTMTFHSARQVGSSCNPSDYTATAGPVTTLDLSQFVAPFTVQ